MVADREDSAATDASDGDKIVLQVGGDGVRPFLMKGKMNRRDFTAMIDSGSPITIFTITDLKQILGTDV